jgi:hypothetical protein
MRKLIFPLSLGLFLFSCEKGPIITSGSFPDPYRAYDAFYPLKDSNEWNYRVVSENLDAGRNDTVYEKALYLNAKSRTDYYRNGQLWSYTFWSRYGSKIMCCGDVVLLDFAQTDCKADSTNIYHSAANGIDIFQTCGFAYLPELAGYSGVKCLRTHQRNVRSDGSELNIIQYFGHNVGLMLRREININTAGKVVKIESSYLQSHKLH